MTLVEVLLVLVIMSAIVMMIFNFSTQKMDELRRDKATIQIQQILNAGLSYYVNNGHWPQCPGSTETQPVKCKLDKDSDLESQGYLPTISIPNPWNVTDKTYYHITGGTQNNASNFYVYMQTQNPVTAVTLAGRLPTAFVTTQTDAYKSPPTQDGSCSGGVPTDQKCSYVVSSVTIPGQNLNNARSVNFASIYSSGGCVPEPVCPTGMKSEIMAIPVSVSGIFVNPHCTSVTCPFDSTPITSYTAWATALGPDSTHAPSCGGSPTNASCQITTPGLSTDRFWRVCLRVETEKGTVNPAAGGVGSGNYWGIAVGSILAITRCAPPNEPVGTPFQVWSN